MALALPLLVGLALAPVLGGRWSELGRLRIRGAGLFYAGIALQLVAFPVRVLPWRTPDRAAVLLWLVSYAFFAAGALVNVRRLPGVPLVVAGTLLNLAAILANGGHMPALPQALRAAGLHFTQSRNSMSMSSPHLAWLVDRWAAPSWVPWGNVFSVGDIFIAAGGLTFALLATGSLRGIRRRVLPALGLRAA
jgi:uncharacterized protein DUF5317